MSETKAKKSEKRSAFIREFLAPAAVTTVVFAAYFLSGSLIDRLVGYSDGVKSIPSLLIHYFAPLVFTCLVFIALPKALQSRSRFFKIWCSDLEPSVLVILTGAVVILAQVVCSLIFGLVLNGQQLSSPLFNMLYQAAVYIVSLIVMLFVVPKFRREPRPDREALGLSGLPTWTDTGLAPVAFIVFMFTAVAAEKLLQPLIGYDSNEAQDVGFSLITGRTDRIVAFIALVIVAPVAEEIIFRGWLYGRLRRRFSAIFCALLVSVFFGFMHGQWNVGVNVAVMSLFLCAQREITGTIWSGILLHMIKNGVAYMALYVIGTY